MDVSAPLVLGQGVSVVPVGDLPEEVRRRLPAERGDFVVTRSRVRAHSRLVDAAGAALLEVFREPCTIVEAVLRFSRDRELDPRKTLEQAFPLLQSVCDAGLLVPAGSAEAAAIEPLHDRGERLLGTEVERCVHIFVDTEVYRVRREGRPLALKIARPGAGARVAQAFTREAAVLDQLEGTIGPRLHEHGQLAGRPYLLMEWLEGAPAHAAARALRSRGNERDLLALCRAVAEAYVALHRRGVLHGDVHPNNVIIDTAVRLCDFGSARFCDPRPGIAEPGRAGVGFYFEPEYARALLEGRPLPAVSSAGEQYALAALLHALWCGLPHLDFQLEKTALFHQIATEVPPAFARRQIHPFPELEAVLGRALQVDASARFPSMDALAAALRDVPDRAVASMTLPALRTSAGSALLSAVAERMGRDEPLEAVPPTASINYGAAGVAYFFYRVASLQDRAEYLAAADIWTQRAQRYAEAHSDAAFYAPEIQITHKTVGETSLYHSATGIHFMRALISHAMGDAPAVNVALGRFVEAARSPCHRLDLTLGHAGLLVGTATLLEAVAGEPRIDATPLLVLGDWLNARLAGTFDADLPLGAPREIAWYGIAHGWAGLLFAILRWCRAARRPASPCVVAALHDLADRGERTIHGLRWPRAANDPVAWVGWCHGGAGYVPLWLLAHATFGDGRFLELADAVAHDAWMNRDGSGANLCCGLAGVSYAALSLYRQTAETCWLERARTMADEAARMAAVPGTRGSSLYKGDVGIALLAADAMQPEVSCFPVFESEGWPPLP
jgi:serine/threonine-protein kinase